MTAATTEIIIKHLCPRDYFSKQIKIPPVKQCIDLIDWSFSDNDAKILCFCCSEREILACSFHFT